MVPSGFTNQSNPPRAGDVIAGYTIESVIARGGMGIVYRARQAELDRSVALKVIAAERASDAVFRARFIREARLAASLDHPNVIPIFEAGEDAGVLFIAMRLVDGPDLARLIASSGRLEPGLAVRLIEQVAAGLDAAHAGGLVHRDVKPANILIGGTPAAPHVYVSDFGVAKSVSPERSLTSSSQWVGTTDYAAPEQRSGRTVDARADVYALGGVLFAALSGRAPDGLRRGSPGSWPAALDPVLDRALAEEPSARYASAGALAAAARRAIEAKIETRAGARTAEPAATAATAATPVATPAATLAARTRVNARRHTRGWVLPALAALAAASTAAVAAALVLGVSGTPSRRPAQTPAIGVVAPPAAASGDGDTVICQRASCTQSGRIVPAPIEGGACERAAGSGAWTRLDGGAAEPSLICLPAQPPAAGGVPPPLPTLIGARLDRAEGALDRLGIAYDTSGGGLFGIFDASNWTVCATSPPPGRMVAGQDRAKLFVDHSC